MTKFKMLCLALVAALTAGCGGGGGGTTVGLTGGTTTLTAAPPVPTAVAVSPSSPAAVVGQAMDKDANAAGIQTDVKVSGLAANTDVTLKRRSGTGLASSQGSVVASGRTNANGEVTFSNITLAQGDVLTVEDTGGGTLLSSTVSVNSKPVVTVSNPQITVRAGETVNLSGSASDPDGDQMFMEWTRVSGPSMQMPAAGNTALGFTPAEPGTYVFRFTATDAMGNSASAQVSVSVISNQVNRNPTASASSTSGFTGSPINLAGTASDPDGDFVTYQWTQVSGPTVAINAAATATASFTANTAGTYVFRLTVDDGKGGTASATATVTVTVANGIPTANAGSDRSVLVNTPVTLSGAGTDADGDTLTYAWTQVSGPVVTLAGANTASASFTPSVAGTHVLRLTVSDGKGGSASDDVTITATAVPVNRKPVATAGGPKWSVGYGSTVQLSASGSTDPDGDALTYSWTQGASDYYKTQLQGANTANPTFVTTGIEGAFALAKMPIPSTTGVLALPIRAAMSYNFTVTVRDPAGLTATSSVETIPAVKTSGTTNVAVGHAVYFNGGVRSTYAWTLSAKPATSQATLTNANTRFPFLVPDVKGSYTVTLGTQSFKINASTWVGMDNALTKNSASCSTCHADASESGLYPGFEAYAQTMHANKVKMHLNGEKHRYMPPRYAKSCLRCHSIGYDETASAANNGADDVIKAIGWSMPTTGGPGTWEAQPDAFKAIASIQCESCHGPGGDHKGAVTKIAKSLSIENCAQCHRAQPAELYQAKHSNPSAYPTGKGRESCAGCHSPRGYIKVANANSGAATVIATGSYPAAVWALDPTHGALSCAVCHDPHKTATPDKDAAEGGDAQLRMFNKDIKLLSGKVVTGTGRSATCMQCHHARQKASGVDTYKSGRLGAHYSSQTDVFVGTNGYEFPGFTYTKSAIHNSSVEGKCVECHMAEPANKATSAVDKLGGHTWKLSDATSNNAALTCAKCHDDAATTLDRPARGDYDGNGKTEGIQTEVHGLLELVSHEISTQNSVGWTTYTTSENATKLTTVQRQAAWNWLLIEDDGSFGVHNPAYSVQLLQQSLKQLKGGTLPAGMVERK